MFSQKKAFLIFQETKTPNKLFILQETELPYISGNGNPKKLVIFQKMKLSSNELIKLLIFQEVTFKA